MQALTVQVRTYLRENSFIGDFLELIGELEISGVFFQYSAAQESQGIVHIMEQCHSNFKYKCPSNFSKKRLTLLSYRSNLYLSILIMTFLLNLLSGGTNFDKANLSWGEF